MTASIVAPPLSDPPPRSLKKKRVLLVDASRAKRDLRAESMRKLGVEVDCAADISEARCWWRANLYNLVLMNVENELGYRDKFCEDVRGATPPQQLAFLVGKPEYLANSPNAAGSDEGLKDSELVLQAEASAAATTAAVVKSLPQRWGILEASRRISEVRSVCAARYKEMRDKPVPPRDLETRFAKRSATESEALFELRREELQ